MAIKLYENFRTVMYTPFYVAHALGAYEAEGVEVCMLTSPSLPETVSGLLAGTVDVAWGGPMRILLDHDRNADSELVAFCEVNARDPFFLVGSKPNPTFRFSDLMDLSIATVAEGLTPWICLQDDIRRAGIDPLKLNRIADRSVEDNVAALRAGKTDVIQLFEPFVEILLREGSGYLWYAAATRGITAYTSFFTRRQTLNKEKDNMLRMTRAMYHAQKWLYSHNNQDIAALIASFFPDLSQDILAGAIERYKVFEIWGRDPFLRKNGFDRLKSAMLSGEFILRDTPYENCVYTGFAEQVVAEDPPSIDEFK